MLHFNKPTKLRTRCYSHEGEGQQGQRVDEALLPCVGEVPEVEHNSTDDVQEDGVQDETGDELFLQLLVVAPKPL